MPGQVGDSALCAHEALPHTSPGGKPPETPGPLSLLPHLWEGRKSVKGSQAAQTPRALDRFPPFPSASLDQEKGASEGGALSASRWSGSEMREYADLKKHLT